MDIVLSVLVFTVFSVAVVAIGYYYSGYREQSPKPLSLREIRKAEMKAWDEEFNALLGIKPKNQSSGFAEDLVKALQFEYNTHPAWSSDPAANAIGEIHHRQMVLREHRPARKGEYEQYRLWKDKWDGEVYAYRYGDKRVQ